MVKTHALPRPDRRDGDLRAVVLRPAAVPVAGLRRPDPAQAEGLPLPGAASPRRRSWPRRPTSGSPACRSARSRRSSPTRRRAARVATIEMRLAVRAGEVRREGDAAPEDAARARPTSSSRRARPTRSRSPRTATLAQGQVAPTVELDEILRAFDPKTRKAWQTWMQAQAQGIDGYGRDINDALGNLGPFAEDTATLVDILNRQQGAVSRLISNSGVVFGALTERQGQLRSLIRNSNTVFATTAARDQQLKEAFVALPTFEDESRVTVRRLARVRDRHGPARHPAAARGARAEPDADRPQRARARPQEAVRRAQPADRRVQGRLPGRRAGAPGPAPAARAGRPGRAAARAAAGLRRALQAAS